ncbi:MAG: TolC family protein, partial [Bacteroidales bacterium]|nr:TolC family protein [Bacteroidales bacterium]
MINIVSLKGLTFLRLFITGTFITLLVLILSASQLRAQQQWSLQDCINYAFDNNLDIKKQVLMVETSKANVLQKKLNTLPSINAGASTVNNWGRTIDQYTNRFATNRVRSDNMYIQGNITLFSGLQKVNLIKRNQLTLQYSQFSLDDLLDNISLTVAGYYLDILFNKELLMVAREQLDVTEQQVRRMEKLVEAGTLARGDLLNIQAQAAREELQVIESENRLDISYLTLQQLIDYPVTEDFDVQTPRLRSVEAPSIDITSDQIYGYAVSNRPEVRLAELNVDIAQKDIAIARGQQSPVISLGGSWGSGYSGLNQIYGDPVFETREFGWTESGEPVYTEVFDKYNDVQVKDWTDQLNDNNNRSVGFYLNIPIFNGWQVRNSITRAKIAQESAEYDLQLTKNNLRKVIEQAYADAVAALKRYGSSLKQVEAQGEA